MEWIRTIDRLPKEEQQVLIATQDEISIGYLTDANRVLRERARKHKAKYPVDLKWEDIACFSEYEADLDRWTHWMELPLHPGEKE